MAVYAIPNLPVYSPLAGIADLYKEYKGIQRQEAQDAYLKEKDKREFDTNKAFKERELTNSERSTQSTMDYHNAALAIQAGQLGATADYNRRHLELQADYNAPTNMAAIMHARSSQATADAARQNALLNARKYNDEMRLANSAVGNPGGNGQPENASSRLFDLTNQFNSLMGTTPYNPNPFNYTPGAW